MAGVRFPTHNTLKTNKMTKEQLMQKWGDLSKPLKNDIDAVIEYEIAKAKEPQPAINPIADAYERGEKIRKKRWAEKDWVKKISETESIDEIGDIWGNEYWDFKTKPEKWELYTEPTEQPSSQVKLDNSFDKERFEAMFRAVVAGGKHIDDLMATENTIKLLDAYYASKEGGENE